MKVDWLQEKVDAILCSMYGDADDNARKCASPYRRGSRKAVQGLYRQPSMKAGTGSVFPEELAWQYDHMPFAQVPKWYRDQFAGGAR